MNNITFHVRTHGAGSKAAAGKRGKPTSPVEVLREENEFLKKSIEEAEEKGVAPNQIT